MERGEELLDASALDERYRKVDEIPFDFERRLMSVVVADETGKTQMVTKGAVEEILAACSHVEYAGAVSPLTDDLRERVRVKVRELGAQGMRGVAVVTALPWTPGVADALGLVALPVPFFVLLAGLMAGYLGLAHVAKRLYVHRHGSLL